MPDTPLLAEIYMGGMNFAPRGYITCQGQVLSISNNTALFSLLGTTFGGNGTTTFALPDLRGRVPIGQGTGPGLTPKTLGEVGGSENVTLLTTQLPAHTHQLVAVQDAGDSSVPTGAYLANTGQLDREYKSSGTTTPMAAGAIGNAGGNQPHNNMQPYLVLNFYIATEGIYPSRN